MHLFIKIWVPSYIHTHILTLSHYTCKPQSTYQIICDIGYRVIQVCGCTNIRDDRLASRTARGLLTRIAPNAPFTAHGSIA
jgi:hypothetical protein